MIPQSESDTPTGRRPAWTCARSRRSAGAFLSLVVAVALLGSLSIVPGSAADAQTDDTPQSETAGGDGPVEDSPASNEPAPGTAGDPYCPRPPADDDDAGSAAAGNDWCIHSEEWIAEVTCGPAFAGEGRAVRYNAGPPTPAWLSTYDLCGYEERLDDCSPAGSMPASSEADEHGENATETGSDPSAATGDDIAEEAVRTGARETSPTSPSAPCGEAWPAGSWYESVSIDPIHGSSNAVGRLSGAWLGSRDHRVANTPTFAMSCEATALSVAVRTGGGVFAGYGRGVPVEYRIGLTIVSQEWQEITATESRRTGVLVPAWLVADFVTLLAENSRGEFLIRVFGHDGTPVGTAAFDLAGIGSITESILRTCGP